jgi:mannose-6-phosphate isomerase
MPLPPLRFRPILKSRAWGGRGLAGLGKEVPPPPAPTIGESWEIADLAPPVADGVSRVASGPYQGATLTDLVTAHRTALLGRARDVGGRFPLLIKFLDAAEHLSVQVHPTAAFAAANPGAHLKTEAWFVVRAAEGAAIYRGIRAGVDERAFRRAIADGTAVDCLVRLPVRAGDCVPLESGLCHALGAGVLVAEVQTPSDTTFRVFDWNRNDPARPLHVDQAMACTLFGAAQGLERAPVTSVAACALGWSDGLRTATLCSNEHFTIDATEASPSGDADPLPCRTDGAPVVIMLTAGEAVLETEGHRPERLRAGDTVLLPADLVPTALHLAPESMALLAKPTLGILRHDGARRDGALA